MGQNCSAIARLECYGYLQVTQSSYSSTSIRMSVSVTSRHTQTTGLRDTTWCVLTLLAPPSFGSPAGILKKDGRKKKDDYFRKKG